MTTPTLVLDRSVLDIDAEFARIVDELTRRGFLTGAVGTAALLGLSACGAGTSGSTGASPAWSFTDDRGKTIHLPHRPTRVVTLNTSLAGMLWTLGFQVVGTFKQGSWADYLTASGLTADEIRGIAAVDTTANQISLEALAQLRPDLIIDGVLPNGALQRSQDNPQVAKVAPVIGIGSTGTLPEAIEHLRKLAIALGASPSAGATDKQRYETSAANLKAAIKAKPGLRAIFCSVFANTPLGINKPSAYTFSATLQSLGLDFPTPPGIHFSAVAASISWELVSSLPVDLIFYYAGQPTGTQKTAWDTAPAVKAGQAMFIPDTTELFLTTYAGYADLLDQVTALIGNAQPGIGPR